MGRRRGKAIPMPSVDLDAPEHAICSAALAARDRELATLKADRQRAHAARERAEAEVKRLLAWIEGYPCECPRPTSAQPDP